MTINRTHVMAFLIGTTLMGLIVFCNKPEPLKPDDTELKELHDSIDVIQKNNQSLIDSINTIRKKNPEITKGIKKLRTQTNNEIFRIDTALIDTVYSDIWARTGRLIKRHRESQNHQ